MPQPGPQLTIPTRNHVSCTGQDRGSPLISCGRWGDRRVREARCGLRKRGRSSGTSRVLHTDLPHTPKCHWLSRTQEASHRGHIAESVLHPPPL